MAQDYNLYHQEHKSIIMWRGKVFEFTEPVDEEALTAFFDKNKPEPYFSSQRNIHFQNNMKVQVLFHGAGDSPQNYAKHPYYINQSKCDDGTVYYFPNNQMKEPTGWFDKWVGKWIKYPSTQDAQQNGNVAIQTLTTICHKIRKHLQVKNIIPCFKGVSAGVNTMLSCVKGFVNQCIDNDDLRKSVCMLRQNVNLQKIPIAGHKGATPEESAKLLYDIDNNLSVLYKLYDDERLKYVKNPNNDRYVLDICDDVSFLRFLRLHSINNTKRFLKYLNDNCISVPMKIVCYESSPSFTKEKKMLEEIQNGKYQNIPNVQLCICQKNGYQRIIFNSLKNKYPVVSDTKVLPSCLDVAYETLFGKKHDTNKYPVVSDTKVLPSCLDVAYETSFGKKHDTSMKNRNTKFDLKKAFHRKKENNR